MKFTLFCRRCGKEVRKVVDSKRLLLAAQIVIQNPELTREQALKFFKQTYLCKCCIKWLMEHDPEYTMSGVL